MEASRINILVACEESQAVAGAFRERGFNAFSCDMQRCRPAGKPQWHIMGDVTPFLAGRTEFTTQDGEIHHLDKWHMIIAHPPCTYLCRLSGCQLKKHGVINQDRLKKMGQARRFFYTCLRAKAQFVAVENPVPLKLAALPKATTYVQPSWYGHKYTKKTLLWLKNLPPLMPSIEYPNPKCYVHCSRGKYRARTFPGVAEAMAKQWGDVLLAEIQDNH